MAAHVMQDRAGEVTSTQENPPLRPSPLIAAAGRRNRAPTPAMRMAKLARLAHARGYLWTAFYNLYAAAVADGDAAAGYQLADVLRELQPTQALMEVDEAFQLALCTPWAAPGSLTRPVVDYLMLDWRVEFAINGTPLAGDDLGAMAERLANRELFATLLQTSAVTDLRLERLLVVLRDYLVTTATLTESGTRLAALLATQASLVEYVWPATHAAASERRGNEPAGADATRALQACMFRPPGAGEIAAIEALDQSPAIVFLLVRVRDEPARHDQLSAQIARQAAGFTLDQHDEPGSCARWVAQCAAPRSQPLVVHKRLRRQQHVGSEILVVGCSSGQDLIQVRATYPQTHVTALDPSAQRLAYAALRCEAQHVQGIDFVPGGLLDVAPLGWVFDVIECLDPRRQFPDLDYECEALARCTTRGSLVRVALPGEQTDRLVGALRASSRASGVRNDDDDIKRFRNELLQGKHGALPPTLLESPDFYTLSGLRDLLFAGGENTPGTASWLAMLDAHGFDFLCEETTSLQTGETPLEKRPETSASGVRDSRRDPGAFSGTRFLWFERRAPRRR